MPVCIWWQAAVPVGLAWVVKPRRKRYTEEQSIHQLHYCLRDGDMDSFRNQDYLLSEQYKDATNFRARVELHRRFSVNHYGFHHWVFDQFQLEEGSALLELGCGPGTLWFSNRQRIPASWQITLTDFSPGMLQEACQRLGEEGFRYQVADAQALPFADASIDAVIANHMLYHVPDLPRALGEVRRVLKPLGCLYASTFGREDLREMTDLLRKHWPEIPWRSAGQHASFVLENGQEILAPFFDPVTQRQYEDALEVTEAEPLAAYILSGRLGTQLSDEQRQALTEVIRQELAEQGTIHISKAVGLFVARKS
jgi:ubiquinone/menaquinone biosynthesis C-methylase UbiE